jgi:hypothetical protein
MALLKSSTNLVWCGFYLAPSPSHKDKGWMGQRATLVGQGWGIAPIYVGQQVIPPSSQKPSTARGTTDGKDAADLAAQAGFAGGTCVYLDLENGPPLPLPTKLSAYVAAWVDAVVSKGFRPGVYCSHTFAARVHTLRPKTRIWAFKVATNARHSVAGPPFPSPDSSGSGFPSADIFQFEQNCTIAVSSVGKLTVDLNSALTADPGAP